MSKNLRQKAVRGVWWSAIERGGVALVQFVIGVLLARILLPEQFGLIGMLSVFIALSQILLNSGFGSAIIQRQDLSDVDTSSVFYLNVGLGLLIASLLFCSAAAIASFFGQSELEPLTRFMSYKVAIASFSVVQLAILRRELKFRAIAVISISAIFVSGIVGVTLAIIGFGVWALAWQQFVMAVVTTVVSWTVAAWRPRLLFSVQSLREMFAFGSKLLVAALMFQGFRHVYSAVIGKLYLPAELGYYTRATGLQQMATRTTNSIVTRVSFPVLATIQDDAPRMRRGLREMLQVLTLINTPLMLGLLVAARPLVIAILTEKWLPSVPLFQVLCLVGALYPLQVINVQFLIATGRSGLNLKIAMVKNLIRVVALVVTCQWGVLAIVWGQLVVALIAYLINCHYTSKILEYAAFRQLRDVFPCVLVGSIMAIAIYPLNGLQETSVWLVLSLQVTLGALVLFVLCWLLKLEAYHIVLKEVARRWKSRNEELKD